jgi:hypothetical protein
MRCGHGAGGASPSLAALRVDALQVCDQIACQLQFRLCDRGIRYQTGHHFASLAGAQLFAHSAGNQLAQQRVQPADDLGAQPAQIVIAARPDPHHHRLALGAEHRQVLAAQRGDGDRAGVVLVVLVDLAAVQQPHSGGQFRRHVHHALVGSDQLLGQQIPKPARSLDRPAARRPASGPLQQHLGLSSRSPHPDPPQLPLTCVNRERGVRSLVRIDTDHHASHDHHLHPITGRQGNRGGHV